MNRSFSQMVSSLMKRCLDVVLVLTGLIVLSPALILVAVLIKRDSPGPVFFRGRRVGKGGRIFRILKFRTMYECPQSYQGPPVTCKEDSRITPLGRWLRNSKINELPQLWNVLKGDMSLVGPRPEDPDILDEWPEEVRNEILSVRPGITSPASVVYHSEENLLSRTELLGSYLRNILPDKMRLDQLYVRNRSLTSDLDIIFWTISLLVPRIAAAKIPEGYLFAGPLTRLLHRYVSWFLIDSVTALVAVGIAGLTWRSEAPLDWGLLPLSILALVLALLFSAVNSISGLNRTVWPEATAEDAMGLILSSSSVTVFILLLNRIQHHFHSLPYPALPAVLIVAIGLLAQLGFVAVRYRLRLLTGLAERWLSWRHNVLGVGERTLILGEGEGCHIANWLIRRGMFRHALSIVGSVTINDPTKQGMRVQGCLMLGTIGDLENLIKRYDVGVIVYTLPTIPQDLKTTVFSLCKKSNVQLVFLDELLGMVDRHLDRSATATEYSMWLQERLESMSMYDPLTGLPNRYLLQERLRQCLSYAKRYNSKPALVFIELNCVEYLKTMLRQQVRNDLLKLMAKRLTHFKRESDALGRSGPNEFALIMENIPDESVGTAIMERLGAVMSKPFMIEGQEYLIDPDIGISLCGEHQEDPRRFNGLDIGEFHSKKKHLSRSRLNLVVPIDRDRRDNATPM